MSTPQGLGASEPSPPIGDEILLTLKEFADLFKRNLSGLYRQAKRGHRDFTCIAGRWHVRVSRRDHAAAVNRQPR